MRIPIPVRWCKGIAASPRFFSILLVVIIITVRAVAIHKLPHVMTTMVTLVVRCIVWLGLGDEILPELCSSLVDRHSMPYDSCRTSCSVGKLAALHPCILEMWHTVDGIEEAKKADRAYRAAKGLSECAHKLKEFLLLLLFFFVTFQTALPFLKCSESLVSPMT